MKRIGVIGYATESGLGVIIKDFFDNKIFDEVLIVRHEEFENHYDWYPNAGVISRHLNPPDEDFEKLVNFVSANDVIIILESPWSPYVIPVCRTLHKKIVLMPNYEWSPWPLDVDLILCPSLLEVQFYQQRSRGIQIEWLNIPVHSDIVWKKRDYAESFLHNRGRGSSNDRNGTDLLLKALTLCDSSPKMTIRSQKPIEIPHGQDNISLIANQSLEHSELFVGQDVFVFVERFCGSSLPLQEAFASGMAVVAGDRFPMNTWLPPEFLVPVDSYEKLNFTGHEFEAACYNPKNLALILDRIISKDISTYSEMGREWGLINSWAMLGPKYWDILHTV